MTNEKKKTKKTIPMDFEKLIRQRVAERNTTLREHNIEETFSEAITKPTLREKVDLAKQPTKKIKKKDDK